MQVTPENVLNIRNAIVGVAERLGTELETQARAFRVGPPGGDPISQRWAKSTNDKLPPLLDECWARVAFYKRAGDYLEQTAKRYGYTEQAIADSFKKFQQANQATWNQQLQQNQTTAGLPPRLRDLVEPPPSQPPPQSSRDLLWGGPQ